MTIQILNAIKGCLCFLILIFSGLVSAAFFFSSLIPWGWSIYFYLRYGVWDQSAEIWVQNNFKPIIYTEWVGVDKIIELTIDFLYTPIVRFMIGFILGTASHILAEKLDSR